ncbi:aldehyde dehydrogenase family protein [[Mycobacterium] nativiensis]|uniref:aldehyde dehydrogenase (NAD(+)) n=1 Tax=[Mycobacterium] nativiensis TaxID=2855503 RepID=A0ABU5XYN4_9MYCO|nr:aldehyde dehydrogenase family protein [Mycolicibacter sp. MYC340]MEB3031805.1 aldehyde dehydrogenase family protein [Mycolicibacter sp. MYC340]
MTTVADTFVLSPAAQAMIDNPRCYIDGRWVQGDGEVIEKLNPTTGQPLGSFQSGSVVQLDTAVAAARRAFDRGEWRADPHERSRILYRLVELIEQNRDILREVVVADVGTPVSTANSIQLDGALEFFRWFAEAARRGPDGWYERGMAPDSTPGWPASAGVIVREPIGLVAAMTSYNFPFNLVAWKFGAALAAGCTVVLQASPRATLSTVALWRLIEQLDLPPGVVNFVLGDVEVGQRLSSHPDVDLVSFTGSVPVGAKIMGQAAPGIKKVVLELGGKSPNILLPGTDVEAAMAPSITRLVSNAGQRCGATSRILVHESQYDEFCSAAKSFYDNIHVGDPRDESTLVGPVIDARHRDFIQGHLDRATAAGAQVVARARIAPGLDDGFFLEPVLLGGLSNDAEFCQEEQFGPVGAVVTYREVDEAVQIANNTKFGLNANVFGPTGDALAVARRIRSGTVTVNGGGRIRAEAPWGGFGQSGVGRESGDEGFREFFQAKHIQWKLDG